MTKKQYDEKRAALMASAKALIDEGKIEEFNKVKAQVDALDADFEAAAAAQANFNAMQTNSIVIPMAAAVKATTAPVAANGVHESNEYREAYLLNLQGKAMTMEQQNAFTGGGNVIPTQTMNKVIAYFDQSPLLKAIDLTYIPSNISIPVESAASDASWVAMGTAATDGTDTLSSVTLSAYKLIKTIEITADVQGMSIDAFENWLVSRLANKIEWALETAIIQGSGSSQATGIVTTVSTATGTYTKAKAKYADLVKIISALGSRYANNAAFIMTRTLFYSDVIGIEDTAGQPVVHADVESPAKMNILGYPVILTDAFGTSTYKDTILFGDPKAYAMNISKGPDVTSDDSAAFRTGSRVYRAMCLADGKLTTSSAFVRFDRASA